MDHLGIEESELLEELRPRPMAPRAFDDFEFEQMAGSEPIVEEAFEHFLDMMGGF